MAKEQFTRTKPHMLAEMTPWLIQRGFTPLGAFQILQGLIVTNPEDRQLVTETLIAQKTVHYYDFKIVDMP